MRGFVVHRYNILFLFFFLFAIGAIFNSFLFKDTHALTPSDYGLREGDIISASGSSDPDIYIVNDWGYKRLFLNPVIFEFYGHLKWSSVRTITSTTRDAFTTSGLFRNCEANDPKVYVIEVTAEDGGTLHWVNVSGDQAVSQDPDFFKKIFCINTNEFTWYPKSAAGYTSLSQVPVYSRTTSTSKLTGKYLMAFHACDTSVSNCMDFRNHKTYVAESDNGATWSIVPGYASYAASVPDLVRRGNTLYVYSPGQLRRYHIDTDIWENPVSVQMTNHSTVESFVDPSPIVDDNGKIVLFYLASQPGGDPARCAAGQQSCTKIFRSATEVAGSDGGSFTVDSGDRATITITSSEAASDPDIFTGPSGYVLYISIMNSIQVYSAGTLRSTYTKSTALSDGYLTRNIGGIASGYYDSVAGQYWTFVHIKDLLSGYPVIRRAMHVNLNSQLVETQFSNVISGTAIGLGDSYNIESPGFAVNIP